MRLLAYVVIPVQVDRVQGYDEDQIALLILDFLNFVVQIPVILGTPTISCIINVMKETEIDALAIPWENARVAHLLAVHRMTAITVGDKFMVEPSSDDYDKVVFTQNVETIETFSSHAVQVRAERAHTGGHINIMAQALWAEDGSLPQGLTVQNMYMELRQGSKNGGKEQYCLLTDPLQDNPGGQGNSGKPNAGATDGVPVAGGGRQAAGSSHPQTDC